MPVDLSKPVEIAEDIFWVGYVVPNDPFQCHVYLIRNGEESILIDPGSMITFPIVIEKIFSLIKLSDVKYIILHHQDPDIVGSFSTLETLFPKGERYIVTHWRTQTLLKHYQWKTPFYLIDEHDFKLKAGERELEFVLTPYAHFPGAFCTFDKKTKTLFSSDIFGAISDEFLFFAEDREEYYKGVELFHKHYMPSRLILNYALDRIEEKKPVLIAPQHGSIIKQDMIEKIISRLRELECGLFMLESSSSKLQILDKLEKVMKRLFRVIISSSDFSVIVENLFRSLKDEIPTLRSIAVSGYVKEGTYVTYTIDDDSISEKIDHEPPKFEGYVFKEELEGDVSGYVYIFADELGEEGLAFLKYLLRNIKPALAASFKKEINYILLEMEKEKLLQKSLTDPLTGLYNRAYLYNFLQKTIEKAIYHQIPFSVAIIDLDHFKKINDTYGHLTGDCVLKELAKILKRSFRSSDCVARYGGEEFVVVMQGARLEEACKKMESVRQMVKEHSFCEQGLKLTISAGVTQYKPDQTIKELLSKADDNLYRAKKKRDMVVCL